jgi:hypothetical protein
MPIGASKVGALGGLVPGGSVTFNVGQGIQATAARLVMLEIQVRVLEVVLGP